MPDNLVALGVVVTQTGVNEAKAELLDYGKTGDAASQKVAESFRQTSQAAQQMSATSRAAFTALTADQQALYQQFIQGAAATQRATQATVQYGDAMTRATPPVVTFRREVDQANAAVTRMAPPAVTGFRQMADAQDNAAKSAGVHGLQLGRLNMEGGTFIGRLLGINTATTRLAAQVGGAVAGYGAMIAVLAGVAIAIEVIEKLAGYNSKAAAEQDRLTKSLEDWYKAEQNGVAGDRVRQIEAEVTSLEKLNVQYEKLKRNAPAQNIGGEGGATIDIGAMFAPNTEKEIRDKGNAVLAAQKEVTAKMEAQQVDALTSLIQHNRATEQERQRAFNTLQFLQSRLRDNLNLTGTNTPTLGERSEIVTWVDQLDKALNPQKVTQFEDRLKTVSESIARFQEQANGMGKELSTDQRVQGYIDQLNGIGRALDDDVARHKISRAEYDKQTASVAQLTQAVQTAGETIKQAYSDQLTKNLQDQYNAQHQLLADWQAGVGSIRDLTAAKQAQNEIDRLAVQLGHDLNDQQKQLIENRYAEAAALKEQQTVYEGVLAAIRKNTPESFAATLRAIRDNQAKEQEEFYDIWAKGFERITQNGLKDFQSFARDVLTLFQDLIRHMQATGEEGVKIKILGYAAAGLAGYDSGYQTGQAVGSPGLGALGGAASGALTGAAIGSVIPGIGTAIGAVIGGLAGLTGGLIGGAAAARERAKAEEQLRQSLAQSLVSIKVQMGQMSQLDGQISDAQTQFAQRAQQIEDAYSGKKNQAERERLLAQNATLEQQYIQYLKDQAAATEAAAKAASDAAAAQQALADAQKNTSAQGNYQLRFLNATGQSDAAFALQQQQELEQAIADGLDAISMRLLENAQAAEKAQREQQKQTQLLTDQLSTAQQSYDALKGVVDGLTQFKSSLATGPLSPLSPRQQLDAARAQLNSVYQAALGGDQAAAGQFSSVAQQFLQLSRGFNASGAGYVLDYNSVNVMTDKLTQQFGQQMTDAQKQVSLLQQQLDVLKSIDVNTVLIAQRPLTPTIPTPTPVGGGGGPRLDPTSAASANAIVSVSAAGSNAIVAAVAENTAAVKENTTLVKRSLDSLTSATANQRRAS